MRIVAPAGSIERFYAAIKAGADEIFMGLKGFGARRNAINLTLNEYKAAIDFAHARGVKVFLTLNTIMMDSEIESISINLRELYKLGLDAVIVQDLGFFEFIKKNFPKLEIHGSTQMTVANHIEANYLKSIGFSRVVLPRELTFEEIKNIREKTDIELEVFVSGALCISYSGNCYMSSFIGGRSGNRGMCAQPCRKKYSCNGTKYEHSLSPKDQLYGYNEIQLLKSIGIDSIKLEGRMKEPNYVFQTVNYYKNLIMGIDVPEKTSSLFNRGYGKGYFYNEKNEILNKNFASSLGINLGTLQNNELTLINNLTLGDGITFLSKAFEKIGGTYINKIDIKNRSSLTFAEIGDVLILKNIPKETKYIFKNYSKYLNDRISSEMKITDKKHKISISVIAKIGEKIILTASTLNNKLETISVTIESDFIVEKANNRATTKETICEKLLEIGDTTFFGEINKFYSDENIFISHSNLKQLKRELIKNLLEKLIDSYRIDSNDDIIKISKVQPTKKESILSAIVSNEKQKEILQNLGIEKIYKKGYDVAKESNLNKIDLSNNLATNLYQLLENKNSSITAGWNMNISNRYAFNHFENLKKVDTIILSPEISYKKIEDIGETKVKKAILAYAKLRGMYTEIEINKNDLDSIENEQGDKFTILKNELGNSEIYFEKPLNILKDRSYLESIGISELVLEFTNETEDEIKEILNGNGVYNSYNYAKGVF